MTRWNSWFHSIEYITEYLENLIEFLKGVDSGVSAEYFTNLSNCERTIIQCSAEFLIEHGTPLTKHILELEGSSYTVSHELCPLLSDLENNFLLVSRGIFGDKTSAALSKLPTPVKKLFAVAKTLSIVATVTQKAFLEGYPAFQAQTAKALEEEPNVDVCQVLQELKNDHANFVLQAFAILWIPAPNVDCERGFSSYGHIFSDLHTGLKTCNIEIMLLKYFSGR
ncbi:hypothetical protein PR048_028424, partial [Dryococelus australis]